MPSAPLGRFLEISIGTPVIRESLAFYESLGFVQAAVGETWSHPYAVVTDGQLFIGLHGRDVPSPSLTFVLPELQLGVEPAQGARRRRSRKSASATKCSIRRSCAIRAD